MMSIILVLALLFATEKILASYTIWPHTKKKKPLLSFKKVLDSLLFFFQVSYERKPKTLNLRHLIWTKTLLLRCFIFSSICNTDWKKEKLLLGQYFQLSIISIFVLKEWWKDTLQIPWDKGVISTHTSYINQNLWPDYCLQGSTMSGKFWGKWVK